MPLAIDDLSCVLAHWDAGAITGLSLNDPVSTLPDTKGSWDLTGSTTTRPTYKPTGINSLPAIQFDGSDDYMVTGSTKSFSSTSLGSCCVIYLPTRKDYSAFGALSTSSGIPSYYPNAALLNMGYSASSGKIILAVDGNYQIAPSGPAGSANSILTSIASKTLFGLSTNGTFMTGGEQAGAANAPASGSYYAGFGRNSLGASSCFAGMLAEWVLFDESKLNEHYWIEGILAAKYAITLPTTHPFYSGAPTVGPSAGGVRNVNIRGGADQ